MLTTQLPCNVDCCYDATELKKVNFKLNCELNCTIALLACLAFIPLWIYVFSVYKDFSKKKPLHNLYWQNKIVSFILLRAQGQ